MATVVDESGTVKETTVVAPPTTSRVRTKAAAAVLPTDKVTFENVTSKDISIAPNVVVPGCDNNQNGSITIPKSLALAIVKSPVFLSFYRVNQIKVKGIEVSV